MSDVDAFLFDLGNVVIGIDFERALGHWARAAGSEPGPLRQRFSFDEAYRRHERGEIDGAAYFAHLRDLLGLDLEEADWAAGWNAIYTGVVSEVAQRLPALARLRPVHGFTNTNPTHHAAWSALYAEALAPFERIFLSHEMGLRKPEAAAFHHVAGQLGLPPGRILFLDDTEENVLGARAVGMPAVHVRSPRDAVQALEPFLAQTTG